MTDDQPVISLEDLEVALAELADLIAIYLHQQAQAEARAEEAT